MDILDELNLSSGFSGPIEIEQVFEVPSEGLVRNKSADMRSSTDQVFSFEVETEAEIDLPINFKQIRVKQEVHPLVRVNEETDSERTARESLLSYLKPSINYSKAFADFKNFFSQYPLVSLNNFQTAEKLFTRFFASRRELAFRLVEFKKAMDGFSTANDRFGKLSFDFKLKAQTLQVTIERSRLKGVKQYLSIPFGESSVFVSFTQWNWRQKKEELLRSRSPLVGSMGSIGNTLSFDVKVWKAFNSLGLKRKHFMKTIDCLERNQKNIVDFIAQANGGTKPFINIMEQNLFNNVSIKTDNQETMFLKFRTNTGQRIEARLTGFASSLVVLT